MFVDLLNKKLYVTKDEGNTFVEYSVPFSPDHLLFHPKEQDHILAYTMSDRTVSYFLLCLHATFRLLLVLAVLLSTNITDCKQMLVQACHLVH